MKTNDYSDMIVGKQCDYIHSKYVVLKKKKNKLNSAFYVLYRPTQKKKMSFDKHTRHLFKGNFMKGKC